MKVAVVVAAAAMLTLSAVGCQKKSKDDERNNQVSEEQPAPEPNLNENGEVEVGTGDAAPSFTFYSKQGAWDARDVEQGDHTFVVSKFDTENEKMVFNINQNISVPNRITMDQLTAKRNLETELENTMEYVFSGKAGERSVNFWFNLNTDAQGAPNGTCDYRLVIQGGNIGGVIRNASGKCPVAGR